METADGGRSGDPAVLKDVEAMDCDLPLSHSMAK